jgi:nucleoredoxin
MFIRLLLLAVFGALISPLAAAPMTFQELDFLVRQRTPENEILNDVTQRKLVAQIDEAGAKALKQSGASDGLLARLQAPAMSLSREEARAASERAEAQKARTQGAAQPATSPKVQTQNQGRPPSVPSNAIPVTQLLEGKLVKLDGDMLKPYNVSELEKVRVYAFYYSAAWCGPCRKFTPTLLAAYSQFKAQHPEFELIFVSRDRDEFNMAEYMRSHKMPWPAVRFEDAKETLKQFAGESIPWLVCVSDTGLPLTNNALDKKYIPPEVVWNAIPELLKMIR